MLAKKYHPDINQTSGARELFIKINEAYEILTDPELEWAILQKIKRNLYKEDQAKPTPKSRDRAARKTKQKVKMSAQQFRAHNIKRFRKEKLRLVKMSVSPILMYLLILWVIFTNGNPTLEEEKELLQEVTFLILFPILMMEGVIGYAFYTVFRDEKKFRE